MNNKYFKLAAFTFIALVQLYVPAKMIWEREEVLETGTSYKFKTAPIDPNDPFMGKFITLSYDENTFTVLNGQKWEPEESIYVSIMHDENGFAKIKSISKTKPKDGSDFTKAKVRFVTGNGSNKLTIDYPFDRYYMEETKAYEAERAYFLSQQDTSKITYALVKIKNGDAVIEDVMIDQTSIREIVKSNQRENLE